MTWRDDVAHTVDGPVRAGWEILDAARSIAFTGVIELPLLPVTRIYLDRGRIYVAERDDHPDLADRLVAVGAVRPEDLARGVVAIDGVDHLGRLFERVPSLDRQRVLLALEMLTEETTAWAAAQSVSEAVSHPYRHHPSGVHLWYAVPVEVGPSRSAFPPPAVATRPPRHRAPEPPPAPAPAPRSDRAPTSAGGEPTDERAPAPADEPTPVEASGDESTDAAPEARPDAYTDEGVDAYTDEGVDLDAERVDEFSLVWPSGEVGSVEAYSPPAHAAEAASLLRDVDRPDADRFDVPDRFEIEIDDDPVAHEVALAVRRAIAAVESGTARGRPVKPVVPVLDDEPDPFERWAGTDRDRRAGDPDDDDDDPWRRRPRPDPLPPPLADEGSSDEERRTTLQRLIAGLRGRPT